MHCHLEKHATWGMDMPAYMPACYVQVVCLVPTFPKVPPDFNVLDSNSERINKS